MKKTVLLIGGHVTPLLATLAELQKNPDLSFVIISRKYATEGDKSLSQESIQFSKLGLPVYYLATGRLQRSFTTHTIPSLLKIPIGLVRAFFLLQKLKPNVVVSFGGYLSVPVVIASWVHRIPVLTHEQSVQAGLANSINSHFAKTIAVSWQSSLKYFPKNKTVVTGNPIRSEIFEKDARSDAIKSFLDRINRPLIYVTGGNQGSRSINAAIFDNLPFLLEKYTVLHQTGQTAGGDYETAQQFIQANYLPVGFIGPNDIGAVLSRAKLVISRSGANTVCELAALGKVAVLVPLPWAQKNEQYENALLLKNAGTAEIVLQDNRFPEHLREVIADMISNFAAYEGHANDAKKLVRLDAAKELADYIQNLL